MSGQVGNWVKEACDTVGGGDIHITGSEPGLVRFRDAIPAGEVWYEILDGANHETGKGTFDGVDLIARTQVNATYLNGIYNDVNPIPLTLSGGSVVACTFSSAAYRELLAHLSDLTNPHKTVDAVIAGTDITVDNTDPEKPIVNYSGAPVQSVTAGVNVTVDNTDPQNPIVASGGQVNSVVAGANVTVDSSDPANPIVSATGGGGGGVDSVVAGANVTVDNTDPANPIVSASSGGASPSAWFSAVGWTGQEAILEQYNVASIDQIDSGLYQITFITPMANTNYSVVASMSDGSAAIIARNTTDALIGSSTGAQVGYVSGQFWGGM